MVELEVREPCTIALNLTVQPGRYTGRQVREQGAPMTYRLTLSADALRALGLEVSQDVVEDEFDVSGFVRNGRLGRRGDRPLI